MEQQCLRWNSGVRWLSNVKPSQVVSLPHHASASATVIVVKFRIWCLGASAPINLTKPVGSGRTGLDGWMTSAAARATQPTPG